MVLLALIVMNGVETEATETKLNKNYGERLSEIAMRAAQDQEFATAVSLWLESAEILDDEVLKAKCYFNVCQSL